MQHCDGEVREREREREVPLCARFQPGSPSVTPSHLAERVAAIKQGPPQIQNESKVPPRFSSISFRVRSAFGAAYARVLAWQSPTSRFAEPFALALVGLGDIFWDNGHCFLFFPLSLSFSPLPVSYSLLSTFSFQLLSLDERGVIRGWRVEVISRVHCASRRWQMWYGEAGRCRECWKESLDLVAVCVR